jgi:methyl-accepting chemotaxis protein
MTLQNLRVQTRLLIAFGLVLALSTLSGGLSLVKLAGIEANLEDVVLDNNVRIKLNVDMANSVQTVARVMRTIVLLKDKDQLTAENDKLLKARADYDKAWTALEKMPTNDAGKAIRAKLAALRTQARPINDKVIALDAADKEDEAIAVLIKEANPANEKWQAAIGENIALQEAANAQQYAEAKAGYQEARALLIGANVLCITVAMLMGWRVTRSITLQLGGEPAEAAELAQSVAQGKLGSHISLRPGDSSSLMANLKAMQTSLVDVVGRVRGNAESVATGSAQISQGNADLSQRTEEQASALEETAASMEQLGSAVQQNADNANKANQLAHGASQVAVKGGDVVAQVVETMKSINESSRKIADIISVIDGIAFQTNILALNAAVEAARAGEQGRGFAVVAGEVRNLAQRSAEAAKEIKTLINASVERVERGTDLVDQAGATMVEVVSSIQRVTDIMGEISAASTEQSAGVAQVGEAVSQMDQVTQQNAALVEESAAASESLKQQAQQLLEAVAVFQLGSDAGVPAAAPAAASAKAFTSPRAGTPAARAKAAPQPRAAAKPAPAMAASASSGGDWESF